MRSKIYIPILAFLLIGVSASAQSKKEIKKFKIKSTTVVATEIVDGKEKSRTDSYEKYDNSGNVTEVEEYNKDGSFKKKESHKYNKNNDPTEEVIYDEKGNVKSKTVTEYNSNKDKVAETV